MKLEPSYYHNNNQYYNWSVYKILDCFISKYSDLYKGDLYDLGCGTRPYEDYFKQYCDTYIGVDWSDSLHDVKADIIADLNKKLEIEDNVADTLVSFSVIEHLFEPQLFLDEAFRILKINGTFILQVPFMWHVHEEPYDYFRFTNFGLKYMFNKAGFKDVVIEATSGFWVVWFVKLNYQLIRIIEGKSFKKRALKAIIKPFIKYNQNLAFYFDKKWPKTNKETQGYWVVAKKR